MRPLLKVCCISSVDEAEAAIRAGAWAIGLVAEMPSGPGTISDAQIAEIAGATQGRVSRFLLSSRTQGRDLAAHVKETKVDTVQIVDRPAPGAYRSIRQSSPHVRIVQVIHVEDETAINAARAAEADGADMLLLDSGRPSAAVKELGGTGRTHDWSISRKIVDAVDRPVLVAGGLSAENCREALLASAAVGMDLCSGVR
ncbi:MAG: phosphoribosylanthranilate isomerase, partial [Pseudomonadota bacterium]